MTENHDAFDLQGSVAVLATMHGKERVIAPLLEGELGLRVKVTTTLDTDRFGTFTREIDRAGSQLDAARAKIAAAFDLVPEARVGIASEGSFGPHPDLPFVALGRELVLLSDRKTGLLLTGYDAGPGTNFAHRVVSSIDGALAFAGQAGFPSHGLVVSASICGKPDPRHPVVKNISTREELGAAVQAMLSKCGEAFVATDMRAHRNPTRMAAIERATADLLRSYRSRCPNCAYPGFDVTERVPGLPCAWCGEPTRLIRLLIVCCKRCAHRVEPLASEQATADPGQCEHCNP